MMTATHPAISLAWLAASILFILSLKGLSSQQTARQGNLWGVIGMAKSLALEVATEGITVNVVCPCTVATDMVLNETTYRLFAPDLEHPTPADIEARFRAPNPVPAPWIQPEDVTRAVMHLVTDPGVLTGTVLEISLGSSARLG